MKTRLWKALGIALLSVFAVMPSSAFAQSTLIAGWDFSQYSNLDFLSLDGETLTNTLVSNHSDLDPTQRQGIESNAFGIMHLDGQFGSTATPLDGMDPFVPTADYTGTGGSLVSNVDQAFLQFGSQGACINAFTEGMPDNNCSDFVMTARDAVTVVFEADRRSAPSVTGNWSISFGGKTAVSGTNTVTINFSDGTTTDTAVALLTPTDTFYSFDFGSVSAERVFIGMSFATPAEGARALIDNVGIAVPEADGGALIAMLALAAGWSQKRRMAD